MVDPPGTAGHGESGETLLEVVIAVMVVGIAIVTLIGGLTTLVLASGVHKRQALAEVELRKYAEVVKAAPWSTTGYTATNVGYAAPAGLAVLDPRCVAASGSTVAAPCATTGVQVVYLKLYSTLDNRIVETIDVVKRK